MKGKNVYKKNCLLAYLLYKKSLKNIIHNLKKKIIKSI